jgi:hypothetical protein
VDSGLYNWDKYFSKEVLIFILFEDFISKKLKIDFFD